MNDSKITRVFASGASSTHVRDIPDTGSSVDVNASMELGFPPLTMQAAGGTPPNGADMNGILKQLSGMLQRLQSGAIFGYDATFAQAIGGYSKGARVLHANKRDMWVSTVDGNMTDPDNGGAGWVLWLVTPDIQNRIGDIVMWPKANIPANALLCDGRTVNSTQYPELYEAWFGTYVAGQDFVLPNLTNGYYPKGYGTNTQPLGARQDGALPNIKGTLGFNSNMTSTSSGAFTSNDTYTGSGVDPDWSPIYWHDVTIDASRSSAVYGNRNTTTVETNSVALNFIVYAS